MEQKIPALKTAETSEQEKATAILQLLKGVNARSILKTGEYLDSFVGLSYEKFFTHLPLALSILLKQTDKTTELCMQEFVESLQNVCSTLYEVATLQDILTDIQDLLASLDVAMNDI